MHKSVRKRKDAGGLSLCPSLKESLTPPTTTVSPVLDIPVLSLESLAVAQRAGFWTRPILEHTEENVVSSNRRLVRKTRHFTVINGLL